MLGGESGLLQEELDRTSLTSAIHGSVERSLAALDESAARAGGAMTALLGAIPTACPESAPAPPHVPAATIQRLAGAIAARGDGADRAWEEARALCTASSDAPLLFACKSTAVLEGLLGDALALQASCCITNVPSEEDRLLTLQRVARDLARVALLLRDDPPGDDGSERRVRREEAIAILASMQGRPATDEARGEGCRPDAAPLIQMRSSVRALWEAVRGAGEKVCLPAAFAHGAMGASTRHLTGPTRGRRVDLQPC